MGCRMEPLLPVVAADAWPVLLVLMVRLAGVPPYCAPARARSVRLRPS